MIPIGDSPNPKGIPIVTYVLIIVNVAIYALVSFPMSMQPVDPGDPVLREYVRVIAEVYRQPVSVEQILKNTTAYDLFTFQYGFRPAAPSLLALLMSMFLHGGLMHLLGNMLFLWIYGDNVEHRLGRFRFLLAYLGTGVAATGLHALLDMSSPLPTIGASGAISGVLGFYFVFFPRNKVRVLFLFFPIFVNIIQVPARIILGIYIVISNILPFMASYGTQGGGVAYGAHIGGFIAGLIIAWLMDRHELTARPREYRQTKSDLKLIKSPFEAIARAMEQGDYEHAAEIYFSLPPGSTRGILSWKQSLALGNWLEGEGRSAAALVIFRRHLRDYPNGPGAAGAHVGAGQVQLTRYNEPTVAYQHFLEALDLNPTGETETQARAGIEAVDRLQKYGRGRLRSS
jgi:membrane associated rhomboid family serine protease